ncbi:Hypothetical protein SMAX5B_006776 [Scophthalmus maximus]|uniref:Mesenteric estrogen-dependent adipogenesis protein n=1 Tax=Scophthalmus maximus TaxID=52904 RepID=A0A2U9B7L5_SCOMX|nr:Hypothetical protein SMAX5B_006776 [Scophthalmus maximus]
MTSHTASRGTITVTGLEEFLREPPAGFSVQEAPGAGHRVRSDPEKSLVLIDDFRSCRGRVVFDNSPGRKVKVHNLWQYTSMRKSLLSKRIYLLMSACRGNLSAGNRKAAAGATALERYVVSIDGGDPLIRWQMERGLDWTISSVAGESYRVDVSGTLRPLCRTCRSSTAQSGIDLTEALESWAAENLEGEPVWSDASFTLKYYSDALFDFPHWFGFSRRHFKVRR